MKPKGSPKSTHAVSRILIVEDHPLTRQGLNALVSSQPDFEVCGEAAGAEDAIGLVAAQRPDLCIVDLRLGQGSGLELIKQINARFPDIGILVSSMHDESLFAERVLRAGAKGFIGKAESVDKVIQAIRQVLGGKVYLSSKMTEQLLFQVAGRGADAAEDSIEGLSNRELEVFQLIGQGLGTRQIAEQLHLSVKTIETYRESIKHKLRLSTNSELVRRAVQWVLEEQ
jgi:DNA-binding NarL/FixJ family response regulator